MTKQYGQAPSDMPRIVRALERFREIYSGENGLKQEMLDGRLNDAASQFENTRDFFEHETRGVTWAYLPGRPVEFRAVFNVVQERLEEQKKPSPKILDELEGLLDGVLKR